MEIEAMQSEQEYLSISISKIRQEATELRTALAAIGGHHE